MPEKFIVFISCGQVTDEEKQLGTGICQLMRERTATPYIPGEQPAEVTTSMQKLQNF